jgi:flavin reductase (DIM6/NTAB) family NADH-FMN oxidoreductase RutF/DNA-binding MarR family transcriptional regulator
MSHPLGDARAYRQALGQFATGVTVVTAETPAGRVGNTVNSFASVSLDPPLILWSLGKGARSFHAFGQARSFAVNVLGADQIGVSQAFSSGEVDKFGSARWKPGANGAPVIEGVIAVFECDTETIHDCGDHIIIVGRVTRYARQEGKPLLYAQGCYGTSHLHPSLDQELRDGSANDPEQDESSIGMLLFRAYHAVYNGFEEHRQAEGLTAPQARVLTTLGRQAPKAIQAVLRDTYLPAADALDAISELTHKGMVETSADGALTLSERGTALRRTLQARLKAFESLHTADVRKQDLLSAHKVLQSLGSRFEPGAQHSSAKEYAGA